MSVRNGRYNYDRMIDDESKLEDIRENIKILDEAIRNAPPMKVFILYEEPPYDQGEILSVFNTREKAEEAIENLRINDEAQGWKFQPENYRIIEAEVK